MKNKNRIYYMLDKEIQDFKAQSKDQMQNMLTGSEEKLWSIS